MDKGAQLDTLWESHNFYLKQIDTLEGEFSFLSDRAKLFFYQPLIEAMRQMKSDAHFKESLPPDVVADVESVIEDYNEEVPVEKKPLLSQIKNTSKDLEALYRKHLHTLRDIKAFYKNYPYDIPPQHELSSTSLLDNINDSTKELLKVHCKAARTLYKQVKNY